jgi:gliding motility-associated-like protein
MRNVLLAAFSAFAFTNAIAQPANSDCATAALLCAHQTLTGNNTGAGGIPGFCPGTDAMVWYAFTTNSIGGVVDITVSDINCPLIPGMDDELSAVVLDGDGTCTLTQFSAASSCVLSSTDFVLTTLALAPQTRYWLVISGAMNGTAVLPAQCGFTVAVSGPGADIYGIDLSAGPDVTIGQGQSTQLSGIGPTYDWSPTAGLSGNGIPDPIASPAATTTYSLSADIAGCSFVDQVLVEIIRLIEPPNTFTPNGDGYNDTWDIPSIADYPGAEVTIHDRWGQRVFRSTGYRDPWDGTNNGKALSVGTYYYHIQLNQLEGRSPPYTGFVTIIR